MAKDIQFKVEQGRVLVPVGEACPFACKYCYTRGGEIGPSRATADEILRRGDLYIAGELEEGRLQEVPYAEEE